MKKVFSLLVLFAVTAATTQAQDAKATQILHKVSEQFKKAKTLKADFKLSINDANGATQNSRSGVFQMKSDKYKIDLGAQQIICDGQSVWTYMPGNKEVQISNYNPDEQAISPAKLFSGAYEKEYKYAHAGQKTVHGVKVDQIVLVPIDRNASFKRVVLYVDPARSMVVGGTISDKNGGSYVYYISNIKVNTNISDSEFTFQQSKHPGVEVIDLR